MAKRLVYSFIVVLVASGCSFCSPNSQRQASGYVANTILGLEIPYVDGSEDIVTHLGYTASYNHRTLVPDWVAYELTAEEVEGNFKTQCSFSRDPDVRSPKASREDYSNTGWDKGHMAPRADMKWSERALIESYYFTNICPQNHSMNAGAWNRIEQLARRNARRYGAVYIVCGPMFTEGRYGTIGQAKVHVPDAFFKAFLTVDSRGYHAVAFVVENNPQTSRPRNYAMSVDSLESMLGRDLYPQLPDTLAEASFVWSDWN